VNHDPIYLDHNATTPVRPEVLDAMLPYLREHYGNPSSAHVLGRRAHDAVERARCQLAGLLGCEADELIFTSGGTESNNLAIRGTSEARPGRRGIVTTVIEHAATERPCEWLARHGRSVRRIGVDADGRVRLDEVRAACDAATALVTVMHSNNETGVLQPIEDIAAAAHACGAVVHTDAAQSVGKVPVDVRALGVDLLSVAGHKLYAPKGVGALYARRGTVLLPFVLGAGHERGLRPGTENVASIVGLGAAAEIASRELLSAAERTRRLRDELWQRLSGAVPGLQLNGHATLRLPNTLNVRFPGVSGNAVLDGAPQVAASTGSACHAGGERPSAVILAMGVAPQAAGGSVRLSLGYGTTLEQIAVAAEALVASWQRIVAAQGG
jgi:cysteine desulfurase